MYNIPEVIKSVNTFHYISFCIVKKTNNPIEKWVKYMNIHIPEGEIQIASNLLKYVQPHL